MGLDISHQETDLLNVLTSSIDRLHDEDDEVKLFQDVERVRVSNDSPKRTEIFYTRGGVKRKIAIVLSSNEQSTLTLSQDLDKQSTARRWVISGSTLYDRIALEEIQAYSGVPEIRYAAHLQYYSQGTMDLWNVASNITVDDKVHQLETGDSAQRFVESPENEFVRTGPYMVDVDFGSMPHTWDYTVSKLLSDVNIFINVHPKPSKKLKGKAKKFFRKNKPKIQKIDMGPFPLKLTTESVGNMVREEVKKVLK